MKNPRLARYAYVLLAWDGVVEPGIHVFIATALRN
jgi:hypothetical protein